MSRTWAAGSTRAWRRIRAYVLTRDGYRCRIAIPGVCTSKATCVHHTKGKAHGDDPRYLQAACQPCNARVNDPGSTSTHQHVVAWIRSQNHPATTTAITAQFPDLTLANLRKILTRAAKRGEITTAGRGLYKAGPTGIPPITIDPPGRSATRW